MDCHCSMSEAVGRDVVSSWVVKTLFVCKSKQVHGGKVRPAAAEARFSHTSLNTSLLDCGSGGTQHHSLSRSPTTTVLPHSAGWLHAAPSLGPLCSVLACVSCATGVLCCGVSEVFGGCVGLESVDQSSISGQLHSFCDNESSFSKSSKLGEFYFDRFPFLNQQYLKVCVKSNHEQGSKFIANKLF